MRHGRSDPLPIWLKSIDHIMSSCHAERTWLCHPHRSRRICCKVRQPPIRPLHGISHRPGRRASRLAPGLRNDCTTTCDRQYVASRRHIPMQARNGNPPLCCHQGDIVPPSRPQSNETPNGRLTKLPTNRSQRTPAKCHRLKEMPCISRRADAPLSSSPAARWWPASE